MTSCIGRSTLAALVILTLGGCAGGQDARTATATEGFVELAVSETCISGSSPQCISVNGQHVMLPSAFEQADVADAEVADLEGQNAVDLTFSAEGAAVLHELTEEAAEAGGSARLMMKIGDEVRAAVMVPEAMSSDNIQILLEPDESAEDVVNSLNGK